ncbi:hypothetical protein D6T64_19505 [Cryobacterium melibiosiphilum]|uniref:DUF2231 domain-containing protein n=1 Tax=Cryobacterium melibiosiphilum TaxID=995039 RepID=A0A3A5M842_9MICO|nr:DUF2231 domain-containing protein [Cryobacterium melibiosiphilum]RJT85130.1 hypothetical protein D6T64_19505 [Cryobacterium melibiosiphilum]
MFDVFFGLPMHPFVVHATEVTVPLAALLVVLAAAWPRFRRWAGYLPLGAALAALVLVPLSTESGEALEHRVGENALIETHSDLAEGLLPWVAGLVVVAAALLWFTLRERRAKSARTGAEASVRRDPKWMAIALIVLALVAATGTTVQAIRIGHSGATAVWSEDMGAPAPAGD